jgi:asparagine synthase (glutamine-hydrolysing)
VLLQLLIRYGTAALGRLRGMYAFCLWDRQRRRAVLARDPYGIKPLYLHQGPGGELLFASELRALLATGRVPRRLDGQGLARFLQLGSLPAEGTLVEGVAALPPGHLGLWQDHGAHQAPTWQVQPHWQASYAPEPPLAYPELLAHTRSALQESVRAHLLADVPVGLFLSGGLDSASLLALAGGGLTSLSIGFAERVLDESQRAAALARQFGSQHHSLRLTAAEAAEALPGFLAAVDQPSVDGFNTYCVSALAARIGLKVVLSGLGGDELFGGYPSFRRLPPALAAQHILSGLTAPTAQLLERTGRGAALRLADGLRQPPSVQNTYACLRGLFAPAETARLLRHWGLPPQNEHPPSREDLNDAERFPSVADQVAWLESSVYMGKQLLRDSDGFSMAHGLELRLPLVDAQLFRSLAAQPAAWRLASGKQLLRDAVPEVLPVVGSGPKQGFSFPFQRWFDDDLALGQCLVDQLPPVPNDLDLRPWARRWGLMVLSNWLQRHLGVELEAA